MLRDQIERYAPWSAANAKAIGALAGDEKVQEAARLANEHGPQLRSHDRFGNRIDWVEFHPAWHELMGAGVRPRRAQPGVDGAAIRGPFRPRRAELSVEPGRERRRLSDRHGLCRRCRFCRTAAICEWHEKTISTRYDQRRLPIEQKQGAVIGYAMTEKQGGSDLRQTQTTGSFVGTENGAEIYLLTGHKWFFSVPTCDGFYTLARTQSGISCFFVPRVLDDGSFNRVFVQRLKDKCGNRSNASSEVEFDRTRAMLVGDEGKGIREILTHSHLTRLDFAVGSAGLMRQALTLAINHASTRNGFGQLMSELPMQANVLADLALESEAATLGRIAHRPRYRRDGHERKRAAAGARRDAGREVLELPARQLFRLRSAAGPWRQRLHHGKSDRAALSRGAAQFHLGRHVQHDVHGRAAGVEPRAGRA